MQRWGLWIGMGALALSGCVSSGDIEALRRDILAVRSDVAAQAKANENSRQLMDERLRKLESEVQNRVESSLRENQNSRVALNQRLEELGTDTRFVQGKLEENASAIRDLQNRVDDADRRNQQTARRLDALDQQLRALGQQGPRSDATQPGAPPVGQPGAPAPVQPGVMPAPLLTPGPSSAAPVPAVPAPAPATPTPAPAAPPAAQVIPPPEDLYKAALQDYTKGDYDLAITEFRTYLKNYPKTALAANAQYWLGECHYSQKNYPQAIEAFGMVVRDYPESPKVPSALFKQGDAYLQSGDTARGTAVLCELITKYSKTREARLARDRNVRCR